MTIDLPTTKKSIKIDTNGVVLTTEKEEPKLTAEYQGKTISFDKDRSFELTLDGAWINSDVLTSLTSTKPINSFSIQNDNSSVNIQELIKEFKELKARVNRTVSLVHNCQRCGASLEVDEHKPIFCCKYCGATYLLGSVQPNSVYN